MYISDIKRLPFCGSSATATAAGATAVAAGSEDSFTLPAVVQTTPPVTC